MSSTKCPYCSTDLNPLPKRKKACPVCGKIIVVRKGNLLTEDDANIDDWLLHFESSGIKVSKRKFDTERKVLSIEFGQQASVNDTVWRILNKNLSEHSYSLMARLASIEGKDEKPYIREALKAQLLRMKKEGTKFVTIMTMNDSFMCGHCKALSGKRFSIEQALLDMPVPSQCEHECRCFYMETS